MLIADGDPLQKGWADLDLLADPYDFVGSVDQVAVSDLRCEIGT
jgi:hypothetical protein